MHFTTATIAAILAYGAFVSAAPAPAPVYHSSSDGSYNPTYPSPEDDGSNSSSADYQSSTYTSSVSSYSPAQTSSSSYDSSLTSTSTSTYTSSSSSSSSSAESTSSSAPPTTTTSSSSGAAATGLSLTQQLFLADTAADRYKLLPDDSQFVFDFNTPQPNPGKGGEVVAANRKTFPALVGSNSGMAVGRVGPCGLNTFHVHPRSAELQIVTEGRLMTEMIPENGVLNADGKPRVIRAETTAYKMTIFPQGSVHAQYNPDCTPTIFVASFASEDFGTGQVLDLTLAATDDVVAASFGQSIAGEDVDRVRKAIPKSLALGVEECLRKCGIKKRSL